MTFEELEKSVEKAMTKRNNDAFLNPRRNMKAKIKELEYNKYGAQKLGLSEKDWLRDKHITLSYVVRLIGEAQATPVHMLGGGERKPKRCSGAEECQYCNDRGNKNNAIYQTYQCLIRDYEQKRFAILDIDAKFMRQIIAELKLNGKNKLAGNFIIVRMTEHLGIDPHSDSRIEYSATYITAETADKDYGVKQIDTDIFIANTNINLINRETQALAFDSSNLAQKLREVYDSISRLD